MKHYDGRIRKGEHRSRATEFKKGQHWRPHAVFREREYLVTEYIGRGRTGGEIAREHGVTEAAIFFWLRKHKIPRRTMSEIRAVKHWGLAGPQNGMYGRRGKDNPNWKGGCTPERQAFYNSAAWATVSRRVRRRDRYRCRVCGLGKEHGVVLEIHHIVPFRVVELRAVASNLILLCVDCHDWVHSKANTKRRLIHDDDPGRDRTPGGVGDRGG